MLFLLLWNRDVGEFCKRRLGSSTRLGDRSIKQQQAEEEHGQTRVTDTVVLTVVLCTF